MGIRKMYRTSGGATFNKTCGECGYCEKGRALGHISACRYGGGVEYVYARTVACAFFDPDAEINEFEQMQLLDLIGGEPLSKPRKKRKRTSAKLAR